MKILVAPDKFKGTLSSNRFCEVVRNQILKNNSTCEVLTLPLADGGDGSLDVLRNTISFAKKSVETIDSLGRNLITHYCIHHNEAYIELASASGLALLPEEDRNPMNTSTYGTGLMIKDAIQNGCEIIHLFLGGSATNDGGIGIASALGVQFFDEKLDVVEPIGSELIKIKSINYSQAIKTNLILYCDVKNPPFGKRGASESYARQKGANDAEVAQLEKGIVNLCSLINHSTGADLSLLEGGGAVGGVALSLVAFFGARLKSGIQSIGEMLNLEDHIRSVDLVISGEGKLDRTSKEGKVISYVADLCVKYSKNLVAIVGQNDLNKIQCHKMGINKVIALVDYTTNDSDAKNNPEYFLRQIIDKLDCF